MLDSCGVIEKFCKCAVLAVQKEATSVREITQGTPSSTSCINESHTPSVFLEPFRSAPRTAASTSSNEGGTGGATALLFPPIPN